MRHISDPCLSYKGTELGRTPEEIEVPCHSMHDKDPSRAKGHKFQA